MKIKIFLILFLLTISVSMAEGWQGIKNEKFTVFFKEKNRQNAIQLFNELNNYGKYAEQNGGAEIKRRYFVIDDFGTVVNGYADPIISDSVHVYTYIPDNKELLMSENWYRTVGIHEYTHMMHLENEKGVPKYLVMFFNNLFYPNFWNPKFFVEGITTFTESEFSEYSGRLNEGFFDEYIMARIASGKKIDMLDSTYDPSYYSIGKYYIYGGVFIKYLANKYGKDKITELFNISGSEIKSYLTPIVPYFGIDNQAKKIYGKSISSLWQEWIEYETEMAKNYKLPQNIVVESNYEISGNIIDNGYIYYIKKELNEGIIEGFPLSIGIYRKNLKESSKEERLYSAVSAIKDNLLIKDNYIYFDQINLSKGFSNLSSNGMGYKRDVYKLDIKTKKEKIIFPGEIRSYCITEKEELIYLKDKKETFGTEIYKKDLNSGKEEKIMDTDYLINEIIEDKGEIFVTAKKNNENYSIYSLNFEKKEFDEIFKTKFAECHLAKYGDKIYFVSNVGNRHNVYYFDIKSRESYKVSSGMLAYYPAYNDENKKLYYTTLYNNGQAICEEEPLVEKYSIPQNNEEEKKIQTKEYAYEKTAFYENMITLLNFNSKNYYSNIDNGEKKYGLILSGADKIGRVPNYYFLTEYENKNGHKNLNAEVGAEIRFKDSLKGYFTLDNNGTETGIYYPFFVSSRKGVREVSGDLILNLDEKTELESVASKLLVSGGGVKNNISVIVQSAHGSGKYSGSEGYFTKLSLVENLNYGKLLNDIVWVKNRDELSVIKDIPKIRGYDNVIKSNDTIYTTVNYTIPLLKIRKGLWNPNIYFYDTGVNFFGDYAFDRKNNKNNESSCGIEILQGIGILNGNGRINPKIGFIYKDGKDFTINYSITGAF